MFDIIQQHAFSSRSRSSALHLTSDEKMMKSAMHSACFLWVAFLRLSCGLFSVDNVSHIILWTTFLILSCRCFSDYPVNNSCTVVRFQTLFLQLPVDVLHTSGWVNVCTFCLLEENVLGLIKELCECSFTLPCSLLAENVLGMTKQLFTLPCSLLAENVLGMIKELCEFIFTLPCSLLAENVLGMIKELCECTFTQPCSLLIEDILDMIRNRCVNVCTFSVPSSLLVDAVLWAELIIISTRQIIGLQRLVTHDVIWWRMS